MKAEIEYNIYGTDEDIQVPDSHTQEYIRYARENAFSPEDEAFLAELRQRVVIQYGS